MLNAELLSDLMGDVARVMAFDLIDSTNAEAKRIAPDLASEGKLYPAIIVAKEQTAGRGRMGRSFLSRANRGIFMSLLYFTDQGLSDAVSVTTATAAIVAEEIEEVCGEPMRIKWVNDIYNARGKVSGILAETLPVGKDTFAVIVGIGINTGTDEFPDELKGIASSIGDISGKEDRLIAGIAKRILLHAAHPESRGYMQAYRARFMLQGERVDLLQNGERIKSGRVVGVDDDGGLLLIPDGETNPIIIRSGEVSVRGHKENGGF